MKIRSTFFIRKKSLRIRKNTYFPLDIRSKGYELLKTDVKYPLIKLQSFEYSSFISFKCVLLYLSLKFNMIRPFIKPFDEFAIRHTWHT